MSSGIYHKNTGYHNRRSIRLHGYDYTRPGYYFITICIFDRKQCLFGDVIEKRVVMNEYGKYVDQCWHEIPAHFPQAQTDEFVVMPNHVHGIIHLIDYNRRGTACRAPTGTIEQFGKPVARSLPTIVRSFKSAISKRIHHVLPAFKWQRNYFEHIIRDNTSLFFIRKYIRENPLQWSIDFENPIDREIQEFSMSEPNDTYDIKD
jgi:REP element-mobilizing transposase RayT